MMVAAVNDRYGDRRAGKRAGGGNAGETAPDNEHVGRRLRGHGHGPIWSSFHFARARTGPSMTLVFLTT
jgi:hypothetical protein